MPNSPRNLHCFVENIATHIPTYSNIGNWENCKRKVRASGNARSFLTASVPMMVSKFWITLTNYEGMFSVALTALVDVDCSFVIVDLGTYEGSFWNSALGQDLASYTFNILCISKIIECTRAWTGTSIM